MSVCAQCQKELPEGARFCSSCGSAVQPARLLTDKPIGDKTSLTGVTPSEREVPHAGNGDAPGPSGTHADAEPDTVGAAAGSGMVPIGTVIQDRYRIVERLGAGNMGSVYRAQDLSLDEDVALKFITPQCAIDESCASLLAKEVRISRQVTHPNICRVHDIGELDGIPFISMEFVDGEDLSSLLRRIGRVHGEKAHQIARQLCAGLQAAHERGVLHCDLKPANIMLDGNGNVRIADFGIAAIIGADGEEETRGTPAYMAPELFTGARASVKSDLYSLGVVLYEIYTGERLFDASSMTELLELHRTERGSVRARIPEAHPLVEAAIASLLTRDPDLRPRSAMAVLARLPGGDPLAAALASGETPSPQLVADAGGAATIRKHIAWLMLFCVIAGALLVSYLGKDVKFLGRVPLPQSGEVLAQKAVETIDDLFPERGADVSIGWRFERNVPVVRQTVQRTDDREAWQQAIDAPWPDLIDFWYRLNPGQSAVRHVKGRMQFDDPPFDRPGMIRLRLSPKGLLRMLSSIPPAVGSYASPVEADESVYERLFEAAGLDPKEFARVPDAPDVVEAAGGEDSRRVLVHHAPTTSTGAWRGTFSGTSETIRIEAAEYGGTPVHFALHADGQALLLPLAMLDRYPERPRTWRFYLLVLLMLVAAGMAWHNVAHGRSDRRGATYIGVATLGLVVAFTLLTGDHGGRLGGFFELLNHGMVHGLLVGGQLVVFYLALEPHVRRTWPETLISWSRVLAGRAHDSLVGHHVLIGCVVGVAIALFNLERHIVTRIAGATEGPPLMFGDYGLEALRGPVSAVGSVLELAVDHGRLSMLLLMVLVVMKLLVRNRRAAALVTFALLTWVFHQEPEAGGALWYVLGWVGTAVVVGAFTFVLVRYGLLSLMISLFVSGLLIDFPLSLDPGDWFGGTTLLALCVVGLISIYAHRCAIRFAV